MMPGFIWALIILILSSIPVPDLEVPDLFDVFSADKVVHFIFYSTLVFLFLNGYRKLNMYFERKDYIYHVFFLCVMYGGLIEIYQGLLLPGRSADLADFFANTIGAVIGVLIFKLFDTIVKSLP